MFYFLAEIYMDGKNGAGDYEEYIRRVKPIVEGYGGRYLARSERVTALTDKWKPERIILIEWDTSKQLHACFESEEYCRIAYKREGSVDSRAIIVEG